MQKISTYLLLLLLFSFGKISYSQISLSQTTVNNYVAAICGTGVSYSNVTLTGDTRAIAQFTGGISGSLGATMNNGVVMSTGLVNTAGALTGTADKDGDNNGGSISQLTSIADDDTYDGIILEFDFVPITNQIGVNFQFGSEEYNWYVESGFNDAFAFFISGPGIIGSQNIALVPSTTIPVTINSINNGYAIDWFWGTNDCSSGPCTNCAYYRDNCNNTFNNAMNGFTTVLTASSAVVPCQTYHIRLMLADGGDEALDSWVFIQQNGLYAVGNPPLSLEATYEFGSSLYEECFDANTITFTIPSAQPADYSFNVTWGGSATAGTDYTALPTTITIPAGQTSVNLPITVFLDALAEGIETIECTYPISVCSMGTTIINVSDAVPLTADAGIDTDVCDGVSASLTASSANGNGAVTYSWDNGAGATASVSVLPATTTTYTVTATDQCGRTATDEVTVVVGTPPVIDAGSDASICSGASTLLTASGGATYSWDNGLGAVNGVSVAPVTTTTYTVTGTAPNGCSATDAVTVTVNSGIIVDAGTNQAICAGTPVTLSGSGATGYSWDNGVSNGISFTPASTLTYTVTGTDGNGCQGTDQVTITVNPIPVVDAGSDQAICAGTPIILSGSGATGYSWNNGVSDGVVFTPASTQTYTVTGTGTGGCQSTDQVVITINSLPPVNAGADQSVCAGTPIILSGSGAAGYTWNNGVSNGVSFTPASTLTYTVTGTDGNGCQNTDQVSVTVNPLPVVSAGLDRTVCSGESVALSGSGTAGYSWNNGISNGVSFTPASTLTYTVTGTDGNGCQNTDQVVVTVNPLPNVSAGADQSVCAGGSVTLSGAGAGGFVWNNGISNGVPFTPLSTVTYTVTGTDGNGCSNTDAVTVTVNQLPPVTAGADQAVCEGDAVTLNGGGAVNYSWSNGVTNGVSFTPSANQTYTVTGTDANGCVNTASVNVVVVPVPVAVINTTGSLSGIPGLTVGFDNGSSGATSYSWNFGNGQTAVTTDVTQGYDITYNNQGVYTVTLIADNGICTATATETVVVSVAPLVVINIPNVVTPNNDGTNDFFNIEAENVASMEIQIVNRWGEDITKFDGLVKSWDAKTDKGDEVTSGVYFFTYNIVGLDGTEISGQGFLHVIK